MVQVEQLDEVALSANEVDQLLPHELESEIELSS